MRTILSCICIIIASVTMAQKNCGHSLYIGQRQSADAAFATRMNSIEDFISEQQTSGLKNEEEHSGIIRIPVVVHVLYRTGAENISDEQIHSQIAALNRDFRKKNADTSKIPLPYRQRAADTGIEFALAISDPSGKATTGIIRKQTNRIGWGMNDYIKSASNGGSDAWDSRYYLNIWVGNLVGPAGYASWPGNQENIDGIVMNYSVFGTINTSGVYNRGRMAVHEIGHWLGLKHIWGDGYCGDDLVHDTPRQGNFTIGCPTSLRSACNNEAAGDMYMNYMDYTNDECLNMFTEGQKQRMLALFRPGGPRHSLLSSRGLEQPWTVETPVHDLPASAIPLRTYPNPATTEVILDFEQDPSWIGQTITLTDMTGKVRARIRVQSVNQKMDISMLKPGIYFIQGDLEKKKLRQKIVKL